MRPKLCSKGTKPQTVNFSVNLFKKRQPNFSSTFLRFRIYQQKKIAKLIKLTLFFAKEVWFFMMTCKKNEPSVWNFQKFKIPTLSALNAVRNQRCQSPIPLASSEQKLFSLYKLSPALKNLKLRLGLKWSVRPNFSFALVQTSSW